MKKIIPIFILIFILINAKSLSQDSLSSFDRSIIDTGLYMLNMSKADLWLPHDYYDNDEHRLAIIKNLFGSPLKSFDIIKEHAAKIRTLNLDNMEKFFGKVCSELELKPFHLLDYDNNVYRGKEMNDKLGAELDSNVNFLSSAILRQYMTPILQVIEALKNDFLVERSQRLAFLQDQADSLLLLSPESESQNVYELKREEDRSYSNAQTFFKYAKGVKQSAIYENGLSLYYNLLKLTNIARKNIKMLRDSLKTTIINTKYGKIAIGGAEDNIWQGDYLFIFDIGGNDKYIMPQLTKAQAIKNQVRCIIDFSGDDTYIGGDYSFGGAAFGINILLDFGGNDNYHAGNFSLGSALFGVGILHDFDGDDFYSGKINCEGSGAFGIGLLIDDKGSDSYNCQTQSQGFGYTRGLGILEDFSGNDNYISSSPFKDFLRYDDHFMSFVQGAGLGYRPIASGGIGFLIDLAGNDNYISDIYGQGTGYWYALGGLYDAQGNDRYQSYQYAQGAGVHLAHGILLDSQGDDVYISHGVSQGCGHDIAFGCLLDEHGDDNYIAESLSLGAGNANAISLFIDAEGDDNYCSTNKGNTMGYSDFRRGYGMPGLFIDAGGRDNYCDTLNNNISSTKSTYGLFADINLEPESFKSTQKHETADEDLTPLSNSIDSLFIQASAAPQKYQKNVNPARDRIISKGMDARPLLASAFATEFPRERIALEYILPKMLEKDTVDFRKFLMDSLNSTNYKTLAVVAPVLAKKKVSTCLARLDDMLKNDNWKIRALAAQQIGEFGDARQVIFLDTLLKDKNPMVRCRAAYSIGQLYPDSIITILKPALNDNMQLVRNNAVQGILLNKPLSNKLLNDIYSSTGFTQEAMKSAAMLIPETYIANTDVTGFMEAIVKLSPSVRETIYKTVMKSNSDSWKEDLKLNSGLEPDDDLRFIINKIEIVRREVKKEVQKKKHKRR